MKKIPMLDLTSENKPISGLLQEACVQILNSGNFVLGEPVKIFEQAMAGYLGAKHVFGVSSGTDALLLALMALDIKPGDEILCPAFTFFATAGSIVRLGAVPVWVDVSMETFNLDLKNIEEKLTPKTRGIIPVHLFGQCCDMDEIMNFAQKNSLFVVEDVAQAMGAKFEGQQAGTFGHFGAYSFYPTKNLGGFGDSGLLVTNDDQLAEKAKCLRTHGAVKQYFHERVGGNFRIDALQAALLSAKLPFLNEALEKRRANADYYNQNLSEIDNALVLPKETRFYQHTWNQYTVRVLGGKRDALKAFLAEKNIDSAIYYPLSLDMQPCFKSCSVNYGPEPFNAQKLCREVLSLPISPSLTEEDLQIVSDTVKKFFRR